MTREEIERLNALLPIASREAEIGEREARAVYDLAKALPQLLAIAQASLAVVGERSAIDFERVGLSNALDELEAALEGKP